MIKKLSRTEKETYYYKDGKKIIGVSGICGNVDECNITDEERKKGINVDDLIL